MKILEKPDLTLYEAVVITKDLVLDYENDHRKQHIENLVLTTTDYEEKPMYDMTTTANVKLEEGKYLILEENGYIYPLNEVCTLEQAIEEMQEYKNSLDKEA